MELNFAYTEYRGAPAKILETIKLVVKAEANIMAKNIMDKVATFIAIEETSDEGKTAVLIIIKGEETFVGEKGKTISMSMSKNFISRMSNVFYSHKTKIMARTGDKATD